MFNISHTSSALNLTPEDLQKERNKRNAKKSRKKKKQYVETLEKRLADLEQKLAHANAELSRYRSKESLYQSGNLSGYDHLIKTQELLKKKGEEIVNNSKEFPQHFISYLSTK